ncbi:hypothetical protein A2765_06380 [Candidatus Kaiserbacteria bacterium RIFCSPHIGHO2_01_FULL_56_24]|uniref:Beta-xylanase n=1 Tax=Candidatus Kaiserbacteria bacterium RIFCSPHIGHO2_01_FULL_56_24 TaxID=1798487 RepID=A0A1F6DA79_9BACT|nr:MAG: hypothetical protein A2765_06380 [Candidatus Kaiserbacteria bacterium RIFCSPHIGHO2_01_FULL_56_24]
MKLGLSRRGAAIALLIIAIALLSGTTAKPRADTLLAAEGWRQFAGATTTKAGLRIQSLGRSIIHQDGSLPQPNPPVNLAGPHLALSGDFKLTARMEDIHSTATIRLYGKPPIVYDQWRFETPSLSIDVSTSTVVARIWDGSSSTSVDERTYPFISSSAVALSVEYRGHVFSVSANGQELGSIPAHHIFDSNEVWFGMDAADKYGWVLSALSVEGHAAVVPPPSFEVNHDDPNALRTLAAAHPRKLRMGAAISFGALVTDLEYRKIALGEFSMLTPENGMKPQFIHPQPDVYSFTETDALVDIALTSGMLVHGHTLVYAKSSPDWMTKAPEMAREKIMLEHIATVVEHFKGRVAAWDVVNEPLSNKRAPYHDRRRGLDDTVWYEAMGEQYIDKAFRAARAADPAAKLYLNDYGLERDGERWDALIALVKRLQSRGVPIDGIGFESHVYGDGDYSDSSTLRAHMRTLAALGLKVRISEIDVTGEDGKEQINQYVLALDACLRAPNCTSYTTWGVTDAYGSTTRSDRYPLVYGTSLLWDKDFKPKPAYAALQARLRLPY